VHLPIHYPYPYHAITPSMYTQDYLRSIIMILSAGFEGVCIFFICLLLYLPSIHPSLPLTKQDPTTMHSPAQPRCVSGFASAFFLSHLASCSVSLVIPSSLLLNLTDFIHVHADFFFPPLIPLSSCAPFSRLYTFAFAFPPALLLSTPPPDFLPSRKPPPLGGEKTLVRLT